MALPKRSARPGLVCTQQPEDLSNITLPTGMSAIVCFLLPVGQRAAPGPFFAFYAGSPLFFDAAGKERLAVHWLRHQNAPADREDFTKFGQWTKAVSPGENGGPPVPYMEDMLLNDVFFSIAGATCKNATYTIPKPLYETIRRQAFFSQGEVAGGELPAWRKELIKRRLEESGEEPPRKKAKKAAKKTAPKKKSTKKTAVVDVAAEAVKKFHRKKASKKKGVQPAAALSSPLVAPAAAAPTTDVLLSPTTAKTSTDGFATPDAAIHLATKTCGKRKRPASEDTLSNGAFSGKHLKTCYVAKQAQPQDLFNTGDAASRAAHEAVAPAVPVTPPKPMVQQSLGSFLMSVKDKVHKILSPVKKPAADPSPAAPSKPAGYWQSITAANAPAVAAGDPGDPSGPGGAGTALRKARATRPGQHRPRKSACQKFVIARSINSKNASARALANGARQKVIDQQTMVLARTTQCWRTLAPDVELEVATLSTIKLQFHAVNLTLTGKAEFDWVNLIISAARTNRNNEQNSKIRAYLSNILDTKVHETPLLSVASNCFDVLAILKAAEVQRWWTLPPAASLSIENVTTAVYRVLFALRHPRIEGDKTTFPKQAQIRRANILRFQKQRQAPAKTADEYTRADDQLVALQSSEFVAQVLSHSRPG